MSPDQLAFSFVTAPRRESGRTESVEVLPQLRDEIARIWGLPLGERVEITFRPSFALPSASGILELHSDPAYPWDSHQPLALRAAGCDFSSRDIERWKLI